MRAPLSWIRDYVDLPDGLAVEDLAAALTALGLKLESLERPGHDITGPLVVGPGAVVRRRAAVQRQDDPLVPGRRRRRQRHR